MAAQKMVFNMPIDGGNCKRAILKAVCKLQGIDQVTIDASNGTVTVIGEADPVFVAAQLRRVRRSNQEEEKKEEKEEDA